MKYQRNNEIYRIHKFDANAIYTQHPEPSDAFKEIFLQAIYHKLQTEGSYTYEEIYNSLINELNKKPYFVHNIDRQILQDWYENRDTHLKNYYAGNYTNIPLGVRDLLDLEYKAIQKTLYDEDRDHFLKGIEEENLDY